MKFQCFSGILGSNGSTFNKVLLRARWLADSGIAASVGGGAEREKANFGNGKIAGTETQQGKPFPKKGFCFLMPYKLYKIILFILKI